MVGKNEKNVVGKNEKNVVEEEDETQTKWKVPPFSLSKPGAKDRMDDDDATDNDGGGALSAVAEHDDGTPSVPLTDSWDFDVCVLSKVRVTSFFSIPLCTAHEHHFSSTNVRRSRSLNLLPSTPRV